MSDGLSDTQRDQVQLEIRRYFDHYLEVVHPKIIKEALSEHTAGCATRKFVSRAVWVLMGVAAAGGVGAREVFALIMGK